MRLKEKKLYKLIKALILTINYEIKFELISSLVKTHKKNRFFFVKNHEKNRKYNNYLMMLIDN